MKATSKDETRPYKKVWEVIKIRDSQLVYMTWLFNQSQYYICKWTTRIIDRTSWSHVLKRKNCSTQRATGYCDYGSCNAIDHNRTEVRGQLKGNSFWVMTVEVSSLSADPSTHPSSIPELSWRVYSRALCFVKTHCRNDCMLKPETKQTWLVHARSHSMEGKLCHANSSRQ